MKQSNKVIKWKEQFQTEFNSLLDQLEELETKREKVWQHYKVSSSYQKEFHYVCEQIRGITKQLEHLEPYLQDQFYMSQFVGSDVNAFEVVEICTPNKFKVRELKATLTEQAKEDLKHSFVPGGFFGHTDNSQQEWVFESDEENPIIEIRRHKNGNYYQACERTCPFVAVKEPYKFYDYNF